MINDLQQLHYTEVTEMLDMYSETDQAFMLWYLLQRYIEDVDKQEKKQDMVQEYALTEMLKIHRLVAEQMREVLYYKWS